MKSNRLLGPAFIVTAAFIGPGSVLIASQAGARYGFQLVWAVLFATVTAIILQEMSGRLGIVTGQGLADVLRRSIRIRLWRWAVLTLIMVGILIGNTAFQTGNLLGAAAGSQAIQSSGQGGETLHGMAILIISSLSWIVILIGRFDLLKNLLTLLVLLMSVVFMLAAIAGQPDWQQVARGLLPSLPEGSGWLVVGLIGTTVVPYNLFLHASATAERWPRKTVQKTIDKERAVELSARDTRLALAIGGLVTLSIMITAALAFHQPSVGPGTTAQPQPDVALKGVADIAGQLQPILGQWATTMFGIGLFAAGFTSGITAPIAAAYAVAGCVGWPNQISDWRLKGVASIVLWIGAFMATVYGASPKEAILVAQVANGLLLPAVAIMLLVLVNQPTLMFRFYNSRGQNLMAVLAIGIVLLIALRQFVMLI